MVDYYGNWTYEPDTPEEKKCDCDIIADWIVESGYKPETTIENVVCVIILYFDCADNFGEYDPNTGCGGYGDGFTLDGCKEYVRDSGGFSAFDYEC